MFGFLFLAAVLRDKRTATIRIICNAPSHWGNDIIAASFWCFVLICIMLSFSVMGDQQGLINRRKVITDKF